MRRSLLFAVLLVLAAVVAVWTLGDGERGSVARGPAEVQPDAPQVRAASQPIAPEDVGNGQRSVVAGAGPTPTARLEPEQEQKVDSGPALVARLQGRCLDGRGLALAGVEIRGPGLAEGARSDQDGRFDVEIELEGRLTRSPDFVFSRAGLGTRRLSARLRLGQIHDLGDIVLELSAIVRGFVWTAEGAPFTDAVVRVEDASGDAAGSPFDGPSSSTAECRTAADGSFEFASIAPGDIRLWAGAEGFRWSSSPRSWLGPGEVRDDVELVLHALKSEDTIELVVLEPDGTPVPHAKLHSRYETSGRSGSGNTTTDEAGRYRLFVEVPATYSFMAEDPDERFRPALARDITPGTHDLVLRLGELKSFTLLAHDDAGEPVPGFEARIQVETARFSSTREAGKKGVLELPVPPEPFSIEVSAEGHEQATLGPFRPDDVPAHLVAVLHALPGVRGRVVSDDGPVTGATVGLHAVVPKTERYEVHGYPCFLDRWSQAQAETDDEGRYDLTLRSSGEWYVRVEAPGFAPSFAGPFAFDAGVGAVDIDVRVGPGGSIVGEVFVDPSQEREGLIVGFSCGDGFPFTVRTDAAGEFRATGLVPGPWQVSWRREEIRSNSTSSSRSGVDGTAPEIPWTCTVLEGQTTRVDLDIAAQRTATVIGSLRLGGRALEGWSASLSSTADEGVESTRTSLDGTGDFRLPLAATGAAQLAFDGTLGAAHCFARMDLDLEAGENHLALDLPAGELRFEVLRELFAQGSRLSVWSKAREELVFGAMLSMGERERFVLDSFPAGPARVEYRTTTGEEGVLEIEVPLGAPLEVSVP